jgi:hypothetical protein
MRNEEEKFFNEEKVWNFATVFENRLQQLESAQLAR